MIIHIFLQAMITYKISYKKVQKIKFVVPKSLQAFTFKEILFMLHAKPFLINILLTRPISFHMLDICSGFPKNNEWGSDYWLDRFLEGKQTILELVTDDENIEFLDGLMVIKGEYLTLAAQQKRKGWYVY